MKKKASNGLTSRVESAKAAEAGRVKARAVNLVKSAIEVVDRDQREIVRVWQSRAEVFEGLVREDPKGEQNEVHAARASELRRCSSDVMGLLWLLGVNSTPSVTETD